MEALTVEDALLGLISSGTLLVFARAVIAWFLNLQRMIRDHDEKLREHAVAISEAKDEFNELRSELKSHVDDVSPRLAAIESTGAELRDGIYQIRDHILGE